jgi:hypothetical protein
MRYWGEKHRVRRVALWLIIGIWLLRLSSAQAAAPTTGTQFESGLEARVLTLSEPYSYPVLQGMRFYPDNPFRLDFFINTRDQSTIDRPQTARLVEYFLAAMSMPRTDIWVNLSPDDKDRVIPSPLDLTAMGAQLLEQDLLLKQISASLTYPECPHGQTYWQAVYNADKGRLQATFREGNSYHKVWIVPDKAVLHVDGDQIFIGRARLKVLMEDDFRALQAQGAAHGPAEGRLGEATVTETSRVASDAFKRNILPALEHEVNHGQRFAPLRQVYHSLILALWYKEAWTTSLFHQLYADQKKVTGIDKNDKKLKDEIYQRYVAAFRRGIYNYIRQDYDVRTREVVNRKYFSGGMRIPPLAQWTERREDLASLSTPVDALTLTKIYLKPIRTKKPPLGRYSRTLAKRAGVRLLNAGTPVAEQRLKQIVDQMDLYTDKLRRGAVDMDQGPYQTSDMPTDMQAAAAQRLLTPAREFHYPVMREVTQEFLLGQNRVTGFLWQRVVDHTVKELEWEFVAAATEVFQKVPVLSFLNYAYLAKGLSNLMAQHAADKRSLAFISLNSLLRVQLRMHQQLPLNSNNLAWLMYWAVQEPGQGHFIFETAVADAQALLLTQTGQINAARQQFKIVRARYEQALKLNYIRNQKRWAPVKQYLQMRLFGVNAHLSTGPEATPLCLLNWQYQEHFQPQDGPVDTLAHLDSRALRPEAAFGPEGTGPSRKPGTPEDPAMAAAGKPEAPGGIELGSLGWDQTGATPEVLSARALDRLQNADTPAGFEVAGFDFEILEIK